MIEGTGPEFTNSDRRMTIYGGKERNTGPRDIAIELRIVTTSEIDFLGLLLVACTKLSLGKLGSSGSHVVDITGCHVIHGEVSRVEESRCYCTGAM